MSRRRLRRSAHAEFLDGGEWVEYGGEMIFAVGFTAGGAPYGLTCEEHLDAMENGRSDLPRARAQAILRDAAAQMSGRERREIDVGYVKKLGEGLSRDVYRAELEVGADRSLDLLALLPKRQAREGLQRRARTEAALLARLAVASLPFRVPRAVLVRSDGEDVLVREFLRGIDVDLRAGRMGSIVPWELVGEVAAAIHALEPAPFVDCVPGHATRREHGAACLHELETMRSGGEALVDRAFTWLDAHLPPDEPSSLLHGDLLGQNILIDYELKPAVIDWEYAQRGDPAFDLAIVTRGSRRPFQVAGGLQRLLDAYNARGRRTLVEAEVRFHELVLALNWLSGSRSGSKSAPPADNAEQTLRCVVGMLR